ncbi:MAG: tyrosine protein kinase [Robiginitomaculum sp.]|nr:MAG: tyrosine protein kinase [Robiginitomaculum sp.]
MSAQTASIIVTLGAVFFAIAVTLWAVRLTRGVREANLRWRKRAEDLEDKIHTADSLFAAHPGLVMVWPDAVSAEETETPPRIYGSQVALGSMLKFAQTGNRTDPANAILDGLADYEARDAAGEDTTLRIRLKALHKDGEPFSLTIIGPNGHFLEADGRAAGAQIALWLTDSTIKGLEESSARGRLEELRHTIAKDPVAFIDMLSKAPQPVWRFSSGLKLDWANGAYLKAVEAQDLDDAIERQLMLDPQTNQLARETLDTGNAQTTTISLVAGGKGHQYELSCFPISGGVACIANDVTETESLRADLQLQARAHNETLNHLADAVVVFSHGQNMVFHNTAFAQLFGLDENWLASQPNHGDWLDYLRDRRRIPEQAKYADWKQSELAHYTDGPNAESPDELWHLPDGRILRMTRLRHPLGGLLFVFENMTDQINLKAQFTTLINVQKATLDKLIEAVAVYGSDGRIRLHNAAFEDLWQLGPKDIAEGEPFDAIAEKCRTLLPADKYWADMKARITDPGGEMRRHVSGEINRTDGSVLTWLSHPLPDGASVVAWSDVTDSKNVEKSLKDRAEAIQAAADLKSHFVEHVSYQVRAPLTTISGYADLLESGYAGPLNDKLKGPVDAIHTASAQLATMLENILDVAAVEAGTLALDLNDVAPAAIIEGVVSLVQTRAEQTRVQIKVDCPEDIGKLRADGPRLKQVLYNLIINALTYTEVGGIIQVGAKAERDMVQFWVSDDGTGIDEDKRALVFEEFESGKGGGAGLGLALVRSFIDLHGGLVRLQSTKGQGTKVTCLLPRLASIENAPPELALQETENAL